MKNFSRLFSVIAIAMAVALCGSANTARATTSYFLRFDQKDYTVNAGDSVSMQLFLDETVTGGSSHRIEGGLGLINADVQATLSGGNGSIFNADPLVGPGFNAPTNSTAHTALNAEIRQAVALGLPGIGGGTIGDTTSVLLGTFFVKAGASGVDVLTPDQLLPGSLLVDLGGGNVFDVGADPNFSITSSNIHINGISGVPEPSSMALLFFGGASFIGMKFRRRKVSVQ